VNIELHIERLTLDGVVVDPGRRFDVQAAVEAELRRLLTAGGVTTELLSSVPFSLGAGEIQVRSRTAPAG